MINYTNHHCYELAFLLLIEGSLVFHSCQSLNIHKCHTCLVGLKIISDKIDLQFAASSKTPFLLDMIVHPLCACRKSANPRKKGGKYRRR